jgi:hypothetical protein
MSVICTTHQTKPHNKLTKQMAITADNVTLQIDNMN